MDIITVDIAAAEAAQKEQKAALTAKKAAEKKAEEEARNEPVVTVDLRPAKVRAKAAPRAAVMGASAVLCTALLFGALSLSLPKKEFSETENRVLAGAPQFSVSAFLKGDFQSGFETWFADHFVGRDTFSALHRLVQSVAGSREAGGVYLGEEDRLFLIPTTPEEENVTALADAINAFASAYPEQKHLFAVAPNAVWTQRKYLPPYAEAPDQQAQLAAFAKRLKNVKTVDLCKALSAHSDEYIYYRTDHHWTSLGAKYAFEAIAAQLETGPLVKKYETHTLSETFEGTLAAKSGSHKVKDSIEIWLPETDIAYYVNYADGGEAENSMYRKAFLGTRDQYAVFFGGNHALVRIRTTADTGRKLLVFKDSYANAAMQFLYPYFDEIVMVDPRYYYDSLKPVMNQYGITDVLYLYHADTFFNDTSLADVLLEAAETPEPAPGSGTEGSVG